jgi:hypothetical protein
MAAHSKKNPVTEGDGLKITAAEVMREEIKLEICNICEVIKLRHGDEIASDVIKTLSAKLAA